MPKENIVSLVIESDGTATFELRVIIKQRRQHSAYSLTKACFKMVKDNFWFM